MKRFAALTGLALLFAFVLFLTPKTVSADTHFAGETPMYRLYNPNSGEHFYTANVAEKNYLDGIGWNYEGVGWIAPGGEETGEGKAVPVYRLYNPNAGDHHYTMDVKEKDALIGFGWNYEGIGWYSDNEEGVPLYRQYNPNAKAGSHNYTTNKAENDYLGSIGWREEGIGWYALKKGYTVTEGSYTRDELEAMAVAHYRKNEPEESCIPPNYNVVELLDDGRYEIRISYLSTHLYMLYLYRVDTSGKGCRYTYAYDAGAMRYIFAEQSEEAVDLTPFAGAEKAPTIEKMGSGESYVYTRPEE